MGRVDAPPLPSLRDGMHRISVWLSFNGKSLSVMPLWRQCRPSRRTSCFSAAQRESRMGGLMFGKMLA